jgi:hypothetical protein
MGAGFLGLLVVCGVTAYVMGMRRRKRLARERQQAKWKRGGWYHAASLRALTMEPWLRGAQGLPPVHDESLFHD